MDDQGTPDDPSDDTVATGVGDLYSDVCRTKGISTDWAYITIKKFGGKWFIGRQPASWGNKLNTWGSTFDRIKYVTKVSDALTLGGVIQKNSETYNGTGGGDSDTYYVLAVIKPVEDHKIGVIYALTNDNTDASVTDADGSWFDVAYNGKAGPVGIAAEFAAYSYDAPNKDRSAFFAAASMAVSDAIGVSLAFAQANDGYVADDDFTPTLLTGTSGNPGAIHNFGSFQTGQNDSATGIVVGGNFKASDDLKLSAALAQITLSDLDKLDLFEIDLRADYKLATNTGLTLAHAIGQTDFTNMPNADDISSTALMVKTVW
jgi:hypothetical protein